MANSKVSEALARPARTVGQGGAGWVVTELIDSFLWDMNDRQYGILVIALTAVFSWLQVQIENRSNRALLRNVAIQNIPKTDNNNIS